MSFLKSTSPIIQSLGSVILSNRNRLIKLILILTPCNPCTTLMRRSKLSLRGAMRQRAISQLNLLFQQRRRLGKAACFLIWRLRRRRQRKRNRNLQLLCLIITRIHLRQYNRARCNPTNLPTFLRRRSNQSNSRASLNKSSPAKSNPLIVNQSLFTSALPTLQSKEKTPPTVLLNLSSLPNNPLPKNQLKLTTLLLNQQPEKVSPEQILNHLWRKSKKYLWEGNQKQV